MKKVLLVIGAALAMAACSESPSAPVAPKKAEPSIRASHDDDFTCKSGYVVAFDENGEPYCAPE